MAADIHTKGFKNPLAWKKACMLINLLEPGDLSSKELFDMMQPGTDVDTTVRQAFQSKTDDIPNFPHTETPILPRVVYRKGLSSKGRLQCFPGMDPIVVIKQPVYYRSRPPGIITPPGLLRSIWILANGTWTKVEDRASPPEQAIRFDRWVERACFQYHAPDGSQLCSSITETAKAAGALQALGMPQLTFSTDSLYLEAMTSANTTPKSIHQCLHPATRVINTLVRIAHGGSQGVSTAVIEDVFQHTTTRAFNKRVAAAQESSISDIWDWDGKSKLVRIHNVPRRRNFIPQECGDCPCAASLICEERVTEQTFKTNTRTVEDCWRYKGDNEESSNRKNEYWTGKTTFRVIDGCEVEGTKPHHEPKPGAITLCINCDGMDVIGLDGVFVPYAYTVKIMDDANVFTSVQMNLHRNNRKILVFRFRRAMCDYALTKFKMKSIVMDLYELPPNKPCFLLMCAEERNWFTFLQGTMEGILFHIVSIPADDDLLSSYGRAIVKTCMRSKSDSSFFAGPCTGGSPWNRLNRWYSDITAHLIEAQRKIFWDLWEEFVEELCDSINRGSPALMELPRGCEYWKDERVVSAIEGTDNTVHDFDGCMYGLKSKHDTKHNPIKKPWRIVSWGVSFPKLKRKCNRKHEHSECAGRDTKLTQTYTQWIAKIIMRGINEHVMKHSHQSFSRSIKDEVTDILKFQMSQDSESPRSHKSRLSYQVGCARLASNFA
eukprot:s1874_g10.t1